MKISHYFVIAALIVAACTVPDSPAQSVYAIESAYLGAVRLEVEYGKLPTCVPGGQTICSTKETIKAIRKADDLAWSALQEAEKAVRTPGVEESKIKAVLVGAKALVNTFVSVTSQLKLKGN